MSRVTKMNVFSIADLESYTNIKAHTIRIWESRYGILNPKRGNGNVRYYSDDDLKVLLNVSFLLGKGKWRISQIAQMSETERNHKVLELAQENNEIGLIVQELTVAMLTFDEIQFNSIINSCSVKWGFDHTISKILGEFLNHIGILWQASSISPAHEHFISNLIRQKLFAACDSFEPDTSQEGVWILYLPEDELHELGLLYMHYFARKSGKNTIYLGQSVPMEDLKVITENKKVEGIISFFTTHPEAENVSKYIGMLYDMFLPNPLETQLVLGGFQIHKADINQQLKNVHLSPGLNTVKDTFTRIITA